MLQTRLKRLTAEYEQQRYRLEVQVILSTTPPNICVSQAGRQDIAFGNTANFLLSYDTQSHTQ